MRVPPAGCRHVRVAATDDAKRSGAGAILAVMRYRRCVMPSDAGARVAVAIPPLDAHARKRALAQDWHLSLLDPNDPDERSVLIRLAHPTLDDAIERGDDELIVDGRVMNPRVHLVIHEVVATQIIDGDPPEMFETA